MTGAKLETPTYTADELRKTIAELLAAYESRPRYRAALKRALEAMHFLDEKEEKARTLARALLADVRRYWPDTAPAQVTRLQAPGADYLAEVIGEARKLYVKRLAGEHLDIFEQELRLGLVLTDEDRERYQARAQDSAAEAFETAVAHLYPPQRGGGAS